MRSLDWTTLVAVAVTSSLSIEGAAAEEARRFAIGRPASESELVTWDIDIAMNGAGLPPGTGSVDQGRSIYEQKCMTCHGAEGQGHPMDRLAGGQGTLTTAKPVKTIGSYWPYATTIFDYVRRAMPLDNPQSLSSDEVYALTAYLLHLNGIIESNAIIDAQNLAKVEMPNRAAFRSDPRPDVSNIACTSNCK
jgi:cytochrome c